MPTKETNRTERKWQCREFAHKDRLGRVIGSGVWTWESDFVPSEWGYEREPGHYFCFEPTATRNASRYGAMQMERRFTTREARDEAVEEYFSNAAKRAAKRDGK